MSSHSGIIIVGNLDFHKYPVQIDSFEWNFETFSSQVTSFNIFESQKPKFYSEAQSNAYIRMYKISSLPISFSRILEKEMGIKKILYNVK